MGPHSVSHSGTEAERRVVALETEIARLLQEIDDQAVTIAQLTEQRDRLHAKLREEARNEQRARDDDAG